jgi:hypothetical protein
MWHLKGIILRLLFSGLFPSKAIEVKRVKVQSMLSILMKHFEE